MDPEEAQELQDLEAETRTEEVTDQEANLPEDLAQPEVQDLDLDQRAVEADQEVQRETPLLQESLNPTEVPHQDHQTEVRREATSPDLHLLQELKLTITKP